MNQATSEATLEERAAGLRRFLQQDPDNPHIIGDLADVLLQLGRSQEARTLIIDRKGTEPDEPELAFTLASAELGLGDFEGAGRRLESLIDNGIDNLGVRFNLAFSHLCRARGKEALDTLAPIRPSWREYPRVMLLMARAYQREGDYEEAIRAARQFVDAEPADTEGRGLLALLHCDAGDWQSAHDLANQVLSEAPDQADALLAAGGAAAGLNRNAEAADYFKRAVEYHPHIGRAWSGVAQTALAAGDITDARSALDKALAAMPDHIGTWHMLAWIQIMEGDLVGARKSFDRSYEIDHRFDETHGGYAVLFALDGELEEAKRSARRALKLNPKCYSARYAESLVLEREGQPDKAREIIEGVMHEPAPASGEPFKDLVAAMRDRLDK